MGEAAIHIDRSRSERAYIGEHGAEAPGVYELYRCAACPGYRAPRDPDAGLRITNDWLASFAKPSQMASCFI